MAGKTNLSATETPRIAVRPREAADMIGVGLTTIYNLRKEGKITFHRIGDITLIRVSELEALIDAHRVGA